LLSSRKCPVSPDAKEKVHLSHKTIYTELLNEIKCLNKGQLIIVILTVQILILIMLRLLRNFSKKDYWIIRALVDHAVITTLLTRVDYEQMNAKQLIEAFNHGLNLIDPVRIIPRKKETAED
jgi:hypothetical protein